MNKDIINEFASFDEYLRQGEQAVDDNFINKEGEENVPSSSQVRPK